MGKSVMTCDCKIIHEDVVKMYKKGFSKSKSIIDISRLFHILSDNTRISILSMLDDNKVCVGDIANVLDMTKSAVSHQLNVLRNAKLIRGNRQGKEVFYTFSDGHIKTIISEAILHLMENK